MDTSTDGIVVAHGHCYSLCLSTMEASTDGLVAHGHCYSLFFLLWMPQQKDLLLHTDTIVILYVPDLFCIQQSQLLINIVIYVYVIPEEHILGVTLL